MSFNSLNLTRSACIAVILIFAIVGTPHAQSTPTDPLALQIDSYLTNLSPFGFSGAVILIKDGKVILRNGYGEADEVNHYPNTTKTVFDIGSLAKQFTAVSVLILERRKQLTLSDPIEKYLDSVPTDKKSITIEQLLTHTAGLDSDFPYGQEFQEKAYEPVTREEALKRIYATELIDTPGNKYAYSNQGYILLAAIVETVSGRPLDDFLMEELLKPAGMLSTGFRGEKLPPVDRSLIAKGYTEDGEQIDLTTLSPDAWSDKGGGQVVSTAEDIERWWYAIRDRKFLTKAQTERMFTPHKGTYGHAWNILKRDGKTVIEHGGDYVGFGSQLAWYKDDKVVMIIVSNRTNNILGTRHVAGRISGQMIMGRPTYRMFAEGDFEFPPASAPIPPEQKQQIAGTYRLSSGGFLFIRERNNRLEIGAIGQDAINAISYASDSVLDNRTILNRASQAVINGLIDHDSTALAQWLHPDRSPTNWYNDLTTMWLDDFKKQHGYITAELVGTVPGGFPVGVQKTYMQLRGENAKDDFFFGWKENKLISLGGAPDLAAITWLNRGKNDSASLAGWNILTFKGFEIRYDVSNSRADSITVVNHGKQFTATRIN